MYTEINTKYRLYISNWLLIMLFLVASMIVVGGLTRLTDSGLSITEWEFFRGFFPPINNDAWIAYFESYKKIPEFKIQNYSMTLSEFKVIFWWEWAHRFFGRVIGLAFLIPLIYFSIKFDVKTLYNFYLIFFLICFQGFFGWYMVQSGLVNNIDVSHFRLSIHLLFAFIILSLIFWNYLILVNSNKKEKKINNYIPEFFLLLIFLQIIIGAFVSGMDAGKIYNTWPLMGNSYFPDDNEMQNLFDISAFNDPSLVQFIHRNLAYIILFFYIVILLHVYQKRLKKLFYIVNVIGFLLLIQILLGILTLVSSTNILIASMHQISSIFLVSSSVYFLYVNINSKLPSLKDN